jgi:hypothetical protein
VASLNVLITHLGASAVSGQLELLRAVAPGSRFVVAYAGEEKEFTRIREDDKALLLDPSLGGPERSFQSYTVLLDLVWERWLVGEPGLHALYLFEFDHLILAPGFEQSLRQVAEETGAGFMGKNAGPRNTTNWHHYTRFRCDRALLEHLARVTVRRDPTTMCGTLGNGMWLSRAAVQSYRAAGPHPRCYGELYVPTLLHHLGHEVVDLDRESPLYDAVRWQPEFTAEEVAALLRAGVTFVHPVKDAGVRMAALRAAGDQSRSEPSVSG